MWYRKKEKVALSRFHTRSCFYLPGWGLQSAGFFWVIRTTFLGRRSQHWLFMHRPRLLEPVCSCTNEAVQRDEANCRGSTEPKMMTGVLRLQRVLGNVSTDGKKPPSRVPRDTFSLHFQSALASDVATFRTLSPCSSLRSCDLHDGPQYIP